MSVSRSIFPYQNCAFLDFGHNCSRGNGRDVDRGVCAVSAGGKGRHALRLPAMPPRPHACLPQQRVIGEATGQRVRPFAMYARGAARSDAAEAAAAKSRAFCCQRGRPAAGHRCGRPRSRHCRRPARHPLPRAQNGRGPFLQQSEYLFTEDLWQIKLFVAKKLD